MIAKFIDKALMEVRFKHMIEAFESVNEERKNLKEMNGELEAINREMLAALKAVKKEMLLTSNRLDNRFHIVLVKVRNAIKKADAKDE